MQIKAIETQYKGYRFRSRLEARWAVFFDALGLRWEYETEGFELGVYGRYLPDFWLPDQSCWIEIKPENVGFHEKCYALVRVTGKHLLLVGGQPWLGEYGIVFYQARGGDGCEPYWEPPFGFATGRKDARELWIVNGNREAHCLNSITDDDRTPLYSSAEMLRAYSAARSARFEHGEKPRVYA
jgi:hypothetical protein